MEPLKQQTASRSENSHQAPAVARVLVVADEDVCPPTIIQQLHTTYQVRRTERLSDARDIAAAGCFDVLLLHPELPDGDGLELARWLADTTPATKTIVISRQHAAQAAVQAMRCGAVDFIHVPLSPATVAARIEAALERSRADRQREQRLVRLKKVCRQLNIARHEISEQIDLLCHDLVSAYREMSSQVSDAAMASEFRTLMRQELDVEDLLRTALEYTLTKTGPTNAAVFLPDGSDRYALGAYVNYDCPRETIDIVLEHLGGAICPQMTQVDEIMSFEDAAAFAQWVGVEAGMLGESEIIAFTCTHEDECLAVIVLFRSRTTPFADDLVSVIETLRPIFAEQLARIIRVHHRASPQWPTEATDDSDEIDFNDDGGLGFGDMAA